MRPSPRVRCHDCQFAWYGASAAHGLHILGACPRCGGELDFLAGADDEQVLVPSAGEHLRALTPAAVLGTPTRWAR